MRRGKGNRVRPAGRRKITTAILLGPPLLLAAAHWTGCDSSTTRNDTGVSATDGARDSAVSPGADAPRADAPQAKPDSAPRLALGQACTSASQCDSGYCADGVCCSQACDSPCLTCSQPKTKGRCVPIALGKAPPSGKTCKATAAATCGLDGKCDGTGHCRDWPAGTICKQPACSSGSTSRLELAHLCDGNGKCTATATINCAPYRCDTANKRCFESCTTGGNQCDGGRVCQNQSCGRLPLGSKCADNKQCASNRCADGVCCNEYCRGSCRACNVSGTTGHCIDVPAGKKPTTSAKSCPVDKTICGRDGTCNGKGSCDVTAKGTPCGTSLCIAGLTGAQTRSFLCNGNIDNPTCVEQSKSCGDYLCTANNAACLVQCQSTKDCRTGRVCGSSKCVACVKNADCGVGNVCVNNTCRQCGKDSDCGGSLLCLNYLCVQCKQTSDCAKGKFCVSNQCVDCLTTSNCTSGKICFHNECVQCLYNKDCSGGKTCVGGTCI